MGLAMFGQTALCADTTAVVSDPPRSSTTFVDSLALLNKAPLWMKKYLNSLIQGNVDHTREKAIDISFGASPSYTREASFGIGALCTALYRVDRNDTLPQPSDVVACLNASLNGFYVLFIHGNTLFPDNRSRLKYRLDIYRKHLNFWGITSEASATNEKSTYDRRSINAQLAYIYRFTHSLYAGVNLDLNYTDAKNMSRPEYLLGERRNIYVTGLGLSFEIDNRDNILNPTSGVHLAYTAMAYPKFLGSAPSFFNSHTFIANYYVKMWRGSVLAFDLYTKLTSSKAPWSMREMVAAGGVRMRGYYMGSYIDNSQIAVQTELRQHIWGRFGATAWLGGATVFSSLNDFKSKEIRPQWLPNGGIGLRFEFKHNVNARIDYGIGRHTSGFIFAIGEAF
jgi:hypothetical protein